MNKVNPAHGMGWNPDPKQQLVERITEILNRPYSQDLLIADLASAWLEDVEKARLEGVIQTHDTYWHSQRMVADEGIGPVALRRKERAEAALAALTNKSKEKP